MTRALPTFQSFFDEQWALVLRFMRSAVGAADAEDLAQEAMLAALRAYPGFDGANPRAWALAIARNKAIDHHRANGGAAISIEELPEPGALDPKLARLGDVDALRRAAAELSEAQRSAVLLRHVLDLPYAEVGVALGCSDAAARQRVREALGNLRVAMAEEAVPSIPGGPR